MALRLSVSAGRVLVFKEVTACKGGVQKRFARGKPRLAFELEIGAKWEVREGEGAAALASGTISIAEATDMEADVFEDIKHVVAAAGGLASSTEALTLVKMCDDPLRECIRAWAAELLKA